MNCIPWETRDQRLYFFGSVFQASIMCAGSCDGKEVYVPWKEFVPMFVPSGFVIGSMGPLIHEFGSCHVAVQGCGHRSAESVA